jgi:hypothetical protein
MTMARLTVYTAKLELGPAIHGMVYSFDPLPATGRAKIGGEDLPVRFFERKERAIEAPDDFRIVCIGEGEKRLRGPHVELNDLNAARVAAHALRGEMGFRLG